MSISYEALMDWRSAPIPAAYGERDCRFYALSVGVGMDPVDLREIGFVWEQAVRALPSLPSVLGWPGRPTNPAFGIDNRRVVAADMRVRLAAPLEIGEASLAGHSRVAEVYDRGEGKHAIVAFSRELRRPDGTVVATVENSILALGQGGFGGQVGPPPTPSAVPEREPDLSVDLPTPPNLALIFRLHGDENPLHVDPAAAARAGFARPILHGAATFGIATHAVLKGALGGEVAAVRSIEARFARSVYPGDLLRTDIWRDGSRRLAFRVAVPARSEIVLDNGLMELAA